MRERWSRHYWRSGRELQILRIFDVIKVMTGNHWRSGTEIRCIWIEARSIRRIRIRSIATKKRRLMAEYGQRAKAQSKNKHSHRKTRVHFLLACLYSTRENFSCNPQCELITRIRPKIVSLLVYCSTLAFR